MKLKPARLERHLFVSDFQIPEHDEKAINAVLSFFPDFKPDYIHFVGDILDLTRLSKYEQDVYDRRSLKEEITVARAILECFMRIARKHNPKVKANLYEGNHERRMLHYLGRRANDLADLEDDGELILSLPYLLRLKDSGITWIPYFKEHAIRGNYLVEHGDIARSHASYTAKAMLEKRGRSGFSGHTHRLGIHYKTQSGKTRFWVETGSLCKLNFSYPYRKGNDWQQGFAIGIYNTESKEMHPSIIPMFNSEFIVNHKLYRG